MLGRRKRKQAELELSLRKIWSVAKNISEISDFTCVVNAMCDIGVDGNVDMNKIFSE